MSATAWISRCFGVLLASIGVILAIWTKDGMEADMRSLTICAAAVGFFCWGASIISKTAATWRRTEWGMTWAATILLAAVIIAARGIPTYLTTPWR
jgi:hypothetical protein